LYPGHDHRIVSLLLRVSRKLDFDDRSLRSVLDKVADVFRTSEVLRFPAETEANGADQRALACSVWSDDHVQVWTGRKLDITVCDEVGHMDSDDRSRLVRLRGIVIRCWAFAMRTSEVAVWQNWLF
jgi:hypothetical protein